MTQGTLFPKGPRKYSGTDRCPDVKPGASFRSRPDNEVSTEHTAEGKRMLRELGLGEGLQAMEAGLALASKKRAEILALARRLAVEIGQRRPGAYVSADDVLLALVGRGIPAEALGPAAGALFRGPEWEFSGKWEQSIRTTNHARALRLWRYIGPPAAARKETT